MLVEFSVKNFGPIRDEAVLSMVASESVPDDGTLFRCGDEYILPVAGLFGANASGKSSVIGALLFLSELVRDSGLSQVGERIRDVSFSFSTEKAPTEFRVEFCNKDCYEYRVGLFDGAVTEESLSKVGSGEPIFRRSADGIEVADVPDSDRWVMEELRSKTDSNNLFLSRCMQFRVGCTMDAGMWFQTMVVSPDYSTNDYLLRVRDMRERAVRMLTNADLGISDIRIDLPGSGVPVPVDPRLTHRIVSSDAPDDCTLGLERESLGTRILLATIPSLADSLDRGGLLVVDEIEHSLHPFIVDYIISLFLSRDSNPNGAQILFTTHDTLIPERNSLRSDELWFTSRDPFEGRTVLYPLSDYRLDDRFSFSRDYLEGRMGAVPTVRRWEV